MIKITQCYKNNSPSTVRRNTAPDRTGPPKIRGGGPQPGKTMGSPGTLPIMGGHP